MLMLIKPSPVYYLMEAEAVVSEMSLKGGK